MSTLIARALKKGLRPPDIFFISICIRIRNKHSLLKWLIINYLQRYFEKKSTFLLVGLMVADGGLIVVNGGLLVVDGDLLVVNGGFSC